MIVKGLFFSCVRQGVSKSRHFYEYEKMVGDFLEKVVSFSKNI